MTEKKLPLMIDLNEEVRHLALVMTGAVGEFDQVERRVYLLKLLWPELHEALGNLAETLVKIADELEDGA